MKEVKDTLEILNKDLGSPPPNQSTTLVGTQSPSPEKSRDTPRKEEVVINLLTQEELSQSNTDWIGEVEEISKQATFF